MKPNIEVNVEKLDFLEHPFADFTHPGATVADITAEHLRCQPDFTVGGIFSMQHYCAALVIKAIELPQAYWRHMIERQRGKLENPFRWLQQYGLLIQLNKPLFAALGRSTEALFAFQCIAEAQQAIWDECTDGLVRDLYELHQDRFNIQWLRDQANQFQTLPEKIAFLLEAKTIFLQCKPPYPLSVPVPFDVQIDLEIERLRQLEVLLAKCDMTPLDRTDEVASGDDANKLEINLSVADLAYFFRALFDIGLLPPKKKTVICKFIAQHFRTKGSVAISWRSMKNLFDSPVPKAMDSCHELFTKLVQKAHNDRGK